jgi:hypothetical protein
LQGCDKIISCVSARSDLTVDLKRVEEQGIQNLARAYMVSIPYVVWDCTCLYDVTKQVASHVRHLAGDVVVPMARGPEALLVRCNGDRQLGLMLCHLHGRQDLENQKSRQQHPLQKSPVGKIRIVDFDCETMRDSWRLTQVGLPRVS